MLASSRVRTLIVVLAFSLGSGVGAYGATTAGDPVDEVLKQRPTANPSRIQHVKQLIAESQGHPRILELRLFHTGQLMGVSRDPQHFRSLIEQLRKLAGDAGDRTRLAFTAQIRIGTIYQHCLKDSPAAYAHYKTMEKHPSLAGKELETDYRRMSLYVRIAQAALGHPVRKFDEVEKYTRLVMAYPHLGMTDRKMYRKFYELYEEAGRLYLTAFGQDPDKLCSIEVYPSHPRLFRWREEALTKALEHKPEKGE